MRKISKNKKNATSYFAWEEALGKKKHKKYDSGFKYYKDVLFELIFCQNGLCAYTEFRVLSEGEVSALASEFVGGRYVGNIKDLPLDIEHFDSRLKKNYGWRWSNLFAVDSLVNQKVKRREEDKLIKNGKSVHYIMKPDNPKYDPIRLLCYEPISNMFIPNLTLNAIEKEQVLEMITCLGLNVGFIKMKRAEYYRELDIRKKLGETIKPHQFITGWKMR